MVQECRGALPARAATCRRRSIGAIHPRQPAVSWSSVTIRRRPQHLGVDSFFARQSLPHDGRRRLGRRRRDEAMTPETLPIPSLLDTLRMAHFAMTDSLRRAQGDILDALGLGPRECAFQLISSATYWRLRAYGGSDVSPSLLIVPAPIKRPYIWDLTPSLSAVRYCLHHG